jgi:hypothetical protein
MLILKVLNQYNFLEDTMVAKKKKKVAKKAKKTKKKASKKK